MKTYLSILMILLASLLVGCNESPTAATYTEPMSQDVEQSSSSVQEDITQFSSTVDDQSSSSETALSSSSSATEELKFVTEMGLVPGGYNTDAITASNATQAYNRMTELFPSYKKINSIGNQFLSTPRTKETLLELLDTAIVMDSTYSDHDSLIVGIDRDLDEESASFRFYTRKDGAFIFIYIEGYDDGVGLK